MPSPRSLACALASALALALVPATASATELTMSSDPPGLELSVDGETAVAPFTRTFEPGTQVTIDAPDPQLLFGYDYSFGVWGGRRIPKRSTITVPVTDTTYTAIFRFTGRRSVVGSDVVGSHVSEAPPGKGETYRVLASRSGTVSRLRLFVDAASSASSLSLGLYADAGGTPGALLGSGVATTVQADAWNEVAIDPQAKLVAGRTYWIGLLNPATGSGVLRWRDRAGGSGGAEETSGSTDLVALPETWATGKAYTDGPLSAYGLAPAPPAEDAVDVEPSRLTFAATAGGPSPEPQSIVVQANSGGCGPCSWRVSGDAPWLSETPDGGDWPTEVSVSVDTKGLDAGVHRATVTVDRGSGFDATTIPVSLHVAAPSEHLIGAWSFDEANGTTVSDSSGHGNDGKIEGAQRTSLGLYGGAIAFDGAGDWITVPDSDSLDASDGMTVEGWVRPNALSGIWRTLAVKESPGAVAWGAFAAAGPGGLPSGVAYTDVQRSARGLARLALTPTWTHLATTYDGSQIRLYVNARLVATTAQKGPLLATSQPLRIGGNVWDEWFDGLIDEVRVYDRALSAAEIQIDIATPVAPGD